MKTESTSAEPRPLLLLEINELPWKMVDRFADTCPNLASFVARSQCHTTIAVDEGELSPWITWPTMHRGMPGSGHHVRFLGQDPASFRGVPIWAEYLQRGRNVGVCGSLQSWPPLDPGEGGFYIPDTFAASSACEPSWLEPLQAWNLAMVGENTRNVSASTPLRGHALKLGLALPRLGIRPRTLASAGMQLLRERISPTYLPRRPIYQTILLWDVFRHLYRRGRPPAFASFFTNHVAGVMHRYWRDEFPEDFGADHGEAHQRDAIHFAMRTLEKILADAFALQRENPELLIVIASSMGQDAKVWEGFEGMSLLLRDEQRLVAEFGQGLRAEKLPAMAPQRALRIAAGPERDRLLSTLAGCVAADGLPLFRTDCDGDRVSITTRTPPRTAIAAGGFRDATGAFHAWEKAGLEAIEVGSATAYHIPEGVLAILDAKAQPDSSRAPVPANEVKQLLLRRAGLEGA